MLFEDCTLDVTKGVLDDGDGGVGATTVGLAVRTMSGQEAAAYIIAVKVSTPEYQHYITNSIHAK